MYLDIDRVTMTGPDDSVSFDECLKMTEEFPFVEWGILVSASQIGSPRFPSIEWLKTIPKGIPNLSMHLCGRWVRDLLIGKVSFPIEFLDCFRRIQLNFHDERTECKPVEFAKALRGIGLNKQFIFQIDRTAGNRHMWAAKEADPELNLVPLFDVSGGAGESPRQWPKPFPEHHYHGYAGGIGPDNIFNELKRIREVAHGYKVWIDMETKVRSDNDRLFDFNKVGFVLATCRPYIEKAPGFCALAE